MTGFVGMDPRAVADVAARLFAQADHLDQVTGRIDGLVRTIAQHWQGNEVADFQQWWFQQHRRRVTELTTGLRQAATGLDRHTQEQVLASGLDLAVFAALPAALPPLIQVCREHTPRALLEMSAAAYQHSDPKVVVGGVTYTAVTSGELSALGIDPKRFDSWSGLDATLYKAPDGSYVLAFTGTEGGSWRNAPVDLAADVAADLGGAVGLSPQSAEAVALARDLDARLDGALSFTGHSLGGRLASVAAVATGGSATTFNAAGVSDAEFAYALNAAGRLDSGDALVAGMKTASPLSQFTPLGKTVDPFADERRSLEGSITAYHTAWDPLTGAQHVVAPSALGQQVNVAGPVWGSHGVDALRSTSI